MRTPRPSYSAYEDGRCDAATSDKSQLAAVRAGFAAPDDHVIMDVTMSKEPLTPAVPAGDDQWFDIVKTVAYLLINAEELDITSANVDEMLNSDSPGVLRLLGAEGSFGQEDLGLDLDFAVDVIKAVGNYGEIYDRYMGPNGDAFTLDRGLNELWYNGWPDLRATPALDCFSVLQCAALLGGAAPFPVGW